MKYALVNGQREEAQPDLMGYCQACNSPMLAKCGNVRMHHWAHRNKQNCDHWWEPETEWHRFWKNLFPKEWQEFIHHADDGEKHIADVRTDQGWVLEFQHSMIHPDERRAREVFYKKMVWIVDGTRRKRDITQFSKTMEDNIFYEENQIKYFKINNHDKCTIINEWLNSPVPVFFDFCEKGGRIWCLLTTADKGTWIIPFSRVQIVGFHNPESLNKGLVFEKLLKFFYDKIFEITQLLKRQQERSRRMPMPGYQRR